MNPSPLNIIRSNCIASAARHAGCRAMACAVAFGVGAMLVGVAPAQVADNLKDLPIDDILEADIEDLMRIQVTTAAGVKQEWFTTPAAMYVITGDDIRRTGHRTLADALRLAPGVFVGQSNGRSWTIGMRGFSGGLANKTLVLLDGRAVYDPLFGGTFWDVQDYLLDDIDRIEVIRGPGSTLWGANAVNGVINIITKSAKDTQGLFLRGGAGTEEHYFGSVRYGGTIGEQAWYRVWGKYFNRDHLETITGESAHDEPDLRCIAAITDGADVPVKIAQTRPDVLVIDLRLPGINVLEYVRQLQEAQPQTRVILYSGYDDQQTIDSAIEAGAWGFVSKHEDLSALFEAIRKVARGEMAAR